MSSGGWRPWEEAQDRDRWTEMLKTFNIIIDELEKQTILLRRIYDLQTKNRSKEMKATRKAERDGLKPKREDL